MTHQLETRLAPLAQKLRSGQLQISTYLNQLEAHFNPENDRVQAFLPEENRFERLRREAADLEDQYPTPASRPALYGVPVGIKDIFHVDGFPTQAGSKLPPQALAGPEAHAVRKLKEAGALILGKTVTTEFAYFEPGPTRNPHNPEHTPGGSSSGSAAAVAAGLTPLALGSQTIGSVIRPAAYCGIIGYKPTAKRISLRGVIPLAPALDHVGLFTQDLPGLNLAASILCTGWHEIPPPPQKPVLGVPEGPYLEKITPTAKAHFEAALTRLAQTGFTVKRVAAMQDFDEIVVWHNEMMAGQMAEVHRDWFEQYSQLYRPKTAALIRRGHQVAPESIKVYQAEREWLREELRELMLRHDIAVWVSPPALGTAPQGLNFTGDPVMNLPWTYAGVPVITVPAGQADNGLPLGLQLSADCNRDELLVHWAQQISQAIANN